jgi:hypothetical protein
MQTKKTNPGYLTNNQNLDKFIKLISYLKYTELMR